MIIERIEKRNWFSDPIVSQVKSGHIERSSSFNPFNREVVIFNDDGIATIQKSKFRSRIFEEETIHQSGISRLSTTKYNLFSKIIGHSVSFSVRPSPQGK